MRVVFALAGLLGGGCWIAAYVLDRVTEVDRVEELTLAGAALLGLAVLGAGGGLVSRGAVWLRLVVALCFLALVASMLGLARQAGDDLLVDALVGGAAAVVAVVAMARRRPPRAEVVAGGGHRGGGSHAR